LNSKFCLLKFRGIETTYECLNLVPDFVTFLVLRDHQFHRITTLRSSRWGEAIRYHVVPIANPAPTLFTPVLSALRTPNEWRYTPEIEGPPLGPFGIIGRGTTMDALRHTWQIF
jgi:hypothetical protein